MSTSRVPISGDALKRVKWLRSYYDSPMGNEDGPTMTEDARALLCSQLDDLAAIGRADHGNGRIIITVRHGPDMHDDDIDMEQARQWAAYRLAESGEIELPDDDSDPDPSGIDDATVVQMIADDIGANLDYEKLR
ncbi:MAG: hypothetical protein OXU74_06645 [Gemmatimonadota bacterium]|nr:hypothetical protein [Gemmatimonadota bacterium]